MPLFIIGIVFLIALLVYVIAKFKTEEDDRSVRERYPEVFRRSDFRDFDEDQYEEKDPSDDGKALYFPTENVETEKHKRNIH
ncbi:MAG: hypothetical protein KBS63_02335 [Clostridiales bacterium]|nr:hypothetical protein [Candidatus Crickella caballi]